VVEPDEEENALLSAGSVHVAETQVIWVVGGWGEEGVVRGHVSDGEHRTDFGYTSVDMKTLNSSGNRCVMMWGTCDGYRASVPLPSVRSPHNAKKWDQQRDMSKMRSCTILSSTQAEQTSCFPSYAWAQPGCLLSPPRLARGTS
jgi:hypothetical protein